MQYPTRVPPVDLGGLSGRAEQVRIKMGPYGEEGTSAMMRTFLNYPEFARSIGRIGTRVTLTSELPPRLAALAALRTAWLGDSEYLWAHIREEAFARGVTEAQVRSVASGVYDDLTSIERHLVEAIDQLHVTHYLDDEKWYRIGLLGPTAVLDVLTTHGFIVTLAVAVNSMGVALEDGLPGWDGLPRDAVKEVAGDLVAPHRVPKRVYEADYALLTPAQIEQANRLGRRGKPTTSKLQKAMINYPDFLKAISAFGKRAIDDTSLPPRIWQIACMRTNWLGDSEYLWSQHGAVCVNALGVTEDDLRGVAEGPDSPLLQDFDRVIVRTVDEMYYENRISDESWRAFDQFGPEAITDLILVHGLYVLQANLARNFGTTLEEGKAGYPPELEKLRDGLQHGKAGAQHV